MSTLTLIFVGGNSFVDKAIEKVSDGEISHTACFLFDSTYESTGEKEEYDLYSGVWLHSPNKYTGNPDAKFIQVEVPYFDALQEEARRLLGTPYGYAQCLRTGIFDILGMQPPSPEWTMHCSGTITRLLRAGGMNVLPDIQPGCIDPSRLYRAVMKDFGGLPVHNGDG